MSSPCAPTGARSPSPAIAYALWIAVFALVFTTAWLSWQAVEEDHGGSDCHRRRDQRAGTGREAPPRRTRQLRPRSSGPTTRAWERIAVRIEQVFERARQDSSARTPELSRSRSTASILVSRSRKWRIPRLAISCGAGSSRDRRSGRPRRIPATSTAPRVSQAGRTREPQGRGTRSPALSTGHIRHWNLLVTARRAGRRNKGIDQTGASIPWPGAAVWVSPGSPEVSSRGASSSRYRTQRCEHSGVAQGWNAGAARRRLRASRGG
jgi:hypothetical protein